MERKQEIIEKIKTLPELLQAVERWRLRGETIVFTNGCFDLLHRGHLEVLLRAADQGDRVVVGLNSDLSVSQLKSSGRPVLSEEERAFMLACQTFVDAVILFDEPTPLRLIKAIQPSVLLKGGDYQEGQVVGAKEIKENGGKVVLVPFVEGFSTTELILRIKKL